jgi:hypothetical protein
MNWIWILDPRRPLWQTCRQSSFLFFFLSSFPNFDSLVLCKSLLLAINSVFYKSFGGFPASSSVVVMCKYYSPLHPFSSLSSQTRQIGHLISLPLQQRPPSQPSKTLESNIKSLPLALHIFLHSIINTRVHSSPLSTS